MHTPTHIPEYSVTTLSHEVKRLIEGNFGLVRVRGEVSGLKIAASGHAYFNLKDANAILTCTCWRHVAAKFKDQLQEGVSIVATGTLTAYAGQSRYQLSVEHLAPAGVGEWMQLFVQLKEKLGKEGLFDQARKKPIPFLPQRIGIVTSPTGAVIHDIIHRIKERFPTQLLIWPVAVQGEGAAEQITLAIQGFNKASDDLRPDVIIVARGGGSIEDLWCFNDEGLARAVANSQIPVISAVGHETDFTIIDFVADLRAPTPTAAAEMSVPVLHMLRSTIDNLATNLASRFMNKLHTAEHKLVSYEYIFRRGDVLNAFMQRTDELDMRLRSLEAAVYQTREITLSRLTLSEQSLFRLFDSKDTLLDSHLRHLKASVITKYKMLYMAYINSCRVLDSLDYKKVLKRGFALVHLSDGKNVITEGRAAKLHAELMLEFHDEKVKVRTLA